MRDLSLHLMDIIQNSIKAEASSINIKVIVNSNKDELIIEIIDNGVGMDETLLSQVRNPFATTRTTRKVGLGIPLLEASATRSGGELAIESQKFKGTSVKASFKISHIDRLPLGDISETIMSVIASNTEIEIILQLSNMKETFNFSVSEIKEKLGEVPINNSDVLVWIREYINEGVKLIFGGVLNEIHS